MEANYVHNDSTTLIQDELVKNELNQIELQYNTLKQQKFNGSSIWRIFNTIRFSRKNKFGGVM